MILIPELYNTKYPEFCLAFQIRHKKDLTLTMKVVLQEIADRIDLLYLRSGIQCLKLDAESLSKTLNISILNLENAIIKLIDYSYIFMYKNKNSSYIYITDTNFINSHLRVNKNTLKVIMGV